MALSKYRTLAMLMSMAQNFELFTHALSGITIIFIPNKESKYRTVRLNTGHPATLHDYEEDYPTVFMSRDWEYEVGNISYS